MSFLNQLTTIIKYIALIGILAHILGEALPRKWFHWDRFPYRTFSWEREGRVYEATVSYTHLTLPTTERV